MGNKAEIQPRANFGEDQSVFTSIGVVIFFLLHRPWSLHIPRGEDLGRILLSATHNDDW
jgi:hypothetical protein